MRDTWLDNVMTLTLARRRKKGRLRVYSQGSDQLRVSGVPLSRTAFDFSSNDYLSLARDTEQRNVVEARYHQLAAAMDSECTLGSSGSRLLSGDTNFARHLEQRLAQWHNRPAALLFNSGYDANLSVLSCLPCDRFIFDEYVHNSLRMGMRLSSKHQRINHDETTTRHEKFLHNDLFELKQKLEDIRKEGLTRRTGLRTLIVVESVYSMDGDSAPLVSILDLAEQFGALVLVDEAHGLGIFGDDEGQSSRGVGMLAKLGLENHPALACSIHTFGKAAGCHGAVACGSKTLRQYLWNYGWPLVYSTSLPLHSLVAIECSYKTITSLRGKILREHMRKMVHLFRDLVQERIIHQQTQGQRLYLIPSMSPIQALVITVNGNLTCREVCDVVWRLSRAKICLYPIKSPTVPKGTERIRIILHSHNSTTQVYGLVECLALSLNELGLLESQDATICNPLQSML